MTRSKDINYGPLSELIGVWKGDKGVDIAPEPEGEEKNPYYETLVFSAIGDVTNAESQLLTAVHYRQIVQRKSNDTVFHDQTGYWMWDEKTATIMHSLTIPRAVCILAGGSYAGNKQGDGSVILHVSASLNDQYWQIIQSPFMRSNARTTKFRQQVCITNNKLSYSQTTHLDIYGKQFEHTDSNELIRQ
jgi:hypothetical protein